MKRPHWVRALQQPLSARIRVRRSTALMAVLFVGLGVLWLAVRTNTSGSSSGAKATNTSPAGSSLFGLGETTTTIRTATTDAPAGTRGGTTTSITTVVVHGPSPSTTPAPTSGG